MAELDVDVRELGELYSFQDTHEADVGAVSVELRVFQSHGQRPDVLP